MSCYAAKVSATSYTKIFTKVGLIVHLCTTYISDYSPDLYDVLCNVERKKLVHWIGVIVYRHICKHMCTNAYYKMHQIQCSCFLEIIVTYSRLLMLSFLLDEKMLRNYWHMWHSLAEKLMWFWLYYQNCPLQVDDYCTNPWLHAWLSAFTHHWALCRSLGHTSPDDVKAPVYILTSDSHIAIWDHWLGNYRYLKTHLCWDWCNVWLLNQVSIFCIITNPMSLV
jgi:hypothetical protein